MNSLDMKYNRMRQSCKKYHELIDELRDLVYGYNISLDCIVPFEEDFLFESFNHKTLGVNTFLERIGYYCQNLSSETADCFSPMLTPKDIRLVMDLICVILFYLKNECNQNEYTFLSVTKILKSFLGTVTDDENKKNPRASTFWIMWTDLPIEERERHPQKIKDAIRNIYDDFDYNYTSRLADCAFHAVRFFLYDSRMDFMGDQIMQRITFDMIREIERRLYVIHQNRQPRG